MQGLLTKGCKIRWATKEEEVEVLRNLKWYVERMEFEVCSVHFMSIEVNSASTESWRRCWATTAHVNFTPDNIVIVSLNNVRSDL